MKNATLFLILFTLNIFCIGCSPDSSISATGEMYYQKYKNNFDKKFIDHFPAKSTQSGSFAAAFSSLEQKKNNISLMLYQYGVKTEEIQNLNNKFKKLAIAKYRSSDSCLSIINRFETTETDENQKMPVIDMSLLNNGCYINKYPIPNFVNYENYNRDRALRLDDAFVIYVLECKKVDSWKAKFNMGPNIQMPENWKNGYSKGVAISQQNQTVIYWTVIW
ncbi:hypothetical protein CPT03_16910 [Pedobacter ginsengisoli]|uniref:Lipoprotein n=1 Tax=Pedobacter ginsengisoli TaxID=363852 RepID=A0A2D1U8W3_9SPHI|nr:hypothetical protein [Pedobacter ginsengisoli]ATP58026.1 hypothetical protein CPT03_16910 [Pedobacter ginsengisoli]